MDFNAFSQHTISINVLIEGGGLMRYKKLLTVTTLSVASLVLTLGWSVGRASASVPGVNEHADLTSTGDIGNSNSGGGSMSHDGRYVAFASDASNLVPNDTNNTWDIFVRDRVANTITRVSVASDGTQGNSYSQGTPSISDDGRYVVFSSLASNLVANDTNGSYDDFLHDMQTGTTQLISTSSSGIIGNNTSDGPVISGDGKFVAFESYATNLVSPAPSHMNIYVKNLATGETQIVSKNANGIVGNADSSDVSISCDGGVVAFGSFASNLVTSDTNWQGDIFVVSRAGGDIITDITAGSDNGAGSPRVSCDGMYVAYASDSTNLVSGDTNSQTDIFRYDRRSASTLIVSVGSTGSQGNDMSTGPAISSDGRLLVFTSLATNLVDGDTNSDYDVFMRDMSTDSTYRVSVNASGEQGNANSFSKGGFSGDGKYLYFTSNATNLITNDDNNKGSGFIAETGL